MAAGDFALVLAQLFLSVLIGWAVAWALTRWARLDELAVVERAALAIAGFLAFAVAAMLLNVVTRGLVFGTPGVVPALAAVPVLWWWRRSRERLPRPSRAWVAPAALALVLVAIYLLPVLLTGSGVRTGDPPWHLGWTEQLLGGEPVPVGPAPEVARNAYPWGFHAFLATMVRLVPASTPLLAHETAHVILLAGIPLVAACLARRVNRRAGLAAAACTSLIGGFGWLMAREPAFVTSPREARFGADLVVASPNSVYELMPPALPRELGLLVAGVAALLLLVALEHGTRRARVLAGVLAGLVGVVSVPMLSTALIWTIVACLFVGGTKWRAAAEVFVPAVAVFATWAAPVGLGYLRYGGFVDITPRLGMEWPLPTALGSYGLLLPLAIGGIAGARSTREGRVLLSLTAASAALLGLAVARDVFDWTVWNNATLLHQGRMWPPVHLLAGVFGGVALERAHAAVARRSARVAAVAAGAVLCVAAASPVLASIRLAQILSDGSAGFEYAGRDFESGSFVREAGELLSPDDVVSVTGSDDLAWALFQTSGARLARYDDSRFERNDLRIRFADLAAEWDERVGGRGFTPSHTVVPLGASGPVLGDQLVIGEFRGERWVLTELD
ncbi:MAG TPA: hypothetical protein VEV43_14650 [Actinomycetota bacterium]|nr:hypothetical protein [Actinomycetota bacterium]